MRVCLTLIALALLCACGTAPGNVAPTQTRQAELNQIATLTAPTATVVCPPTLPPPTVGSVQMTVQAIRQKDYATQAVRMAQGCEQVRKVYADYGQPFDQSTVVRDPQQILAEMLAMVGITDTRSLSGGIRRDAYWGYIKTCVGL